METDTQQALKDHIVAALVMNGWDQILKEWWRSYNPRRAADQLELDRVAAAYLGALAGDVAEALANAGASAPE